VIDFEKKERIKKKNYKNKKVSWIDTLVLIQNSHNKQNIDLTFSFSRRQMER